MTSTSFRDSVNALGWSRRDPEPATTTAPPSSTAGGFLSRWNPFSQEGYLRLPTVEGAPLPAANRRDEEESFLACTFLYHISWFIMITC